MLASWPAARPTLAFLQLLLGPANAAFSGHLLLGVLDPADELVTGQRRDVVPGTESPGVGDQHLAQVPWKLVHHPTGHSRAAHRAVVVVKVSPLSQAFAIAGRREGANAKSSVQVDESRFSAATFNRCSVSAMFFSRSARRSLTPITKRSLSPKAP